MQDALICLFLHSFYCDDCIRSAIFLPLYSYKFSGLLVSVPR